MTDPLCRGCHERDAQIARLEARVADLERLGRESAYLRDAAKAVWIGIQLGTSDYRRMGSA